MHVEAILQRLKRREMSGVKLLRQLEHCAFFSKLNMAPILRHSTRLTTNRIYDKNCR